MSTARVRTEPAEGYLAPAGLDLEAAYRAMESRDQRFDGRLWVGVTTTGIYCRPVVPGADPEARQRPVLRRAGRRGVGGVPRLPALPARLRRPAAGRGTTGPTWPAARCG